MGISRFSAVFLLAVSIGNFQNAFAANTTYIEEKSAFCHSKNSLAKYLYEMSNMNIQGMNKIVMNGECKFVPDGSSLVVEDFLKTKIGKMPVVAFEHENQTYWTFHAFLISKN